MLGWVSEVENVVVEVTKDGVVGLEAEMWFVEEFDVEFVKGTNTGVGCEEFLVS